MPCYDIELPGGVRGVVCARGQRRRRCYHCNRLGADRLCDGPVAVNKTCNRPICGACATPNGPDTDYCRDCARDWPGCREAIR